MNISILGAGRWGSFLSWYLSNQKFNVTLWGRASSDAFNTLKEKRANEYIKLNQDIFLTSDISIAINSADIIVISIPSQNLREFARNLVKNFNLSEKPIILCMKGLEADTCKRLSEICIEEGIEKENIAVWLGPGHIQDFRRGIPNCMTIDSYNQNLTIKLAELFNSNLIRFYYGNDIIGNEIGAACKNIMGIVAGFLDGLNFSSLKGPLMSRGAYEVSKFITAMGGNGASAYGLTHLGDYETTLFSSFSNNRNFGEQFAKNLSFTKLAEGVATTKAVHLKALELGIEMPITSASFNVLYNNASIENELNKLFCRNQKLEQIKN